MMQKALTKENLTVEIKNLRDDPEFFKIHEIKTCPVLLVFDNERVVDTIRGKDEIIQTLKDNVQDREI